VIGKSENEGAMNRSVRIVGLSVVAAAAAGLFAMWYLQRQMHVHRRDLFSPRPFRRLAALGHIGREPASVDAIRLLRDFISWEPRSHLRARAQAIMTRMTAEVGALAIAPTHETA
jgi:hypothetical protein